MDSSNIEQGQETPAHLEDMADEDAEAEDAALARAIAAGLETEHVCRRIVMEALRDDGDGACSHT